MIYEIANLRISIKNRCKYTEIFCEKYLSNDQAAPFDLEVSVTDEEFYEEKKISEGYSDGYIENICLYRAICRCLPKLNRMLLHAAVLEYEGNAYAFLGRSGTGKSTCINTQQIAPSIAITVRSLVLNFFLVFMFHSSRFLRILKSDIYLKQTVGILLRLVIGTV